MTPRFIKYIFIFLLFGYINFLSAQALSSYKELIASADAYFAKKDYYNAKTTYQLALQLDANAEYPKNKIKEIIQKLDDELDLRIIFEEKVQNAEEAYAKKDFQKAIKLYQEASATIAYEEKPKQEIARITNEWEAFKNNQIKFENLLTEAKEAKQKQNYTSAIGKLEEANKLVSSKSEVLSEIAQLKLLLKQQNAKQTEFNNLVAEADSRMEQSQFQAALKSYQSAIALFENDSYVLAQLALVKEAIKIEEAYNKAIEKADAYYITLDLDNAKNAYEEAGKIWPEKAYPKNMLAKLDEAKKRRDSDLEGLNKEYNAKIVLADKQFTSQKYDFAYDLYIKALNIKPEEIYPQNQIQKINKLLASGSIDIKCEIFENGKALAGAFIEVIENGVSEEIAVSNNGQHKLKLKLNANYLLKFKKAGYIHKIFSVDSHLPDDKDLNAVFETAFTVDLFPVCSIDLSTFDETLATIAFQPANGKFVYDKSRSEALIRRAEQLKNECAQILAEEQKLNKYNSLLSEAEAFKLSEDYTSALNSYQNAVKIYPEKRFVQEQILALNTLVNLDKEYNQFVLSGDAKYAQGKLNDALFDYYKAGNLKPKAAYPQERITEIDKILAIQNVEEKGYLNQLHLADSLFDTKLWEKAITQYEELIALKKDDEYPKNKLKLAQQFLIAQNKLNASYMAAIQKADAYFDSQSLPNAKIAYLEASRLKPDEPYPLYKIEDINTIVEQKDIRKINDRYRDLVASADRLFAEKAYPLSLTQYKQASVLKPNETYPPQQISKINQILAEQNELDTKYQGLIKSADSAFYLNELRASRSIYVQAGALKPLEIYPPQQIAKIDQSLSLKNDFDIKFNGLIKSADSAFYLKELRPARNFYVRARTLKPLEEYPVIQINKIDALLSELSALDLNYHKVIARADSNLAVKQYDSAKSDYKLGLTYKPSEIYPKKKIEEIDALLAQMNAMEFAYQKAIQDGDRNFVAENYLLALGNFKDALKMKANEEYPKSRINAIELILDNLNFLDKTYNEAIAKADDFYRTKQYAEALPFYKEAQSIKPNEKYPPDQINRITSILDQQLSLEEAYTNALAMADKLFGEKQYQEALSPYQKASQLKPSENYPKDQIAKIRELLVESDKKYQAYIKQGDDAYRMVIFQDAIVAYENALGIYPNEAYPKMMLEKIDTRIRRESVVSIVESREIISIGKEKRYTFKPIDYRDRQNNYILIEMKNATNAPMRVFINFGKDGVKNGGYSVNLVQRDGFTKYFVRIDRQLRWQNEDNNWISLLPEGGDLEVSRIQISREEKSN